MSFSGARIIYSFQFFTFLHAIVYTLFTAIVVEIIVVVMVMVTVYANFVTNSCHGYLEIGTNFIDMERTGRV